MSDHQSIYEVERAGSRLWDGQERRDAQHKTAASATVTRQDIHSGWERLRLRQGWYAYCEVKRVGRRVCDGAEGGRRASPACG